MGASPSVSLLPTGLAVVWDMLLTAHFMTLVMITVWHTNIFLSALFYFVFATIDALYFSACVEKVPSGEAAHCHQGFQCINPSCATACVPCHWLICCLALVDARSSIGDSTPISSCLLQVAGFPS